MQTATINIEQIVSRNPQIMSGALCFTGTRAPVATLYDYVEDDPQAGLAEFLDGFPHITRAKAEAVLQIKREDLNI